MNSQELLIRCDSIGSFHNQSLELNNFWVFHSVRNYQVNKVDLYRNCSHRLIKYSKNVEICQEWRSSEDSKAVMFLPCRCSAGLSEPLKPVSNGKKLHSILKLIPIGPDPLCFWLAVVQRVWALQPLKPNFHLVMYNHWLLWLLLDRIQREKVTCRLETRLNRLQAIMFFAEECLQTRLVAFKLEFPLIKYRSMRFMPIYALPRTKNSTDNKWVQLIPKPVMYFSKQSLLSACPAFKPEFSCG